MPRQHDHLWFRLKQRSLTILDLTALLQPKSRWIICDLNKNGFIGLTAVYVLRALLGKGLEDILDCGRITGLGLLENIVKICKIRRVFDGIVKTKIWYLYMQFCMSFRCTDGELFVSKSMVYCIRCICRHLETFAPKHQDVGVTNNCIILQ